MAEFVREHTQSAVFRFNRVITYPEIGPRQVVTSQATPGRARLGIEIGIPAVAPDGIASLRSTTGLFPVPRMDDSEVVDVSVRFGEDAIRIAIVSINLIRGPEVQVAVIA
jgi:hypothetical protein